MPAAVPATNLPDESAPWGRKTNARLDALEKAVSRAAEGRTNTSTKTVGTTATVAQQIQAIQDQEAFLAQLKTSVDLTSDSAVISWSAVTDASYSVSAATITTTTTLDLVALVTYNAIVSFSTTRGTSGITTAEYTGNLALDGTAFAVDSLMELNVAGAAASGVEIDTQNPFSVTGVVTVPAGTHTFTHLYKRLAGTGPAGTVSGGRRSGQLIVQFIGSP